MAGVRGGRVRVRGRVGRRGRLSVDIMDSTCDIRGTFFNEDADRFNSILQVAGGVPPGRAAVPRRLSFPRAETLRIAVPDGGRTAVGAGGAGRQPMSAADGVSGSPSGDRPGVPGRLGRPPSIAPACVARSRRAHAPRGLVQRAALHPPLRGGRPTGCTGCAAQLTMRRLGSVP